MTIKNAIDCRDTDERRFLNRDEINQLAATLVERTNSPQPFDSLPVEPATEEEQALLEANKTLDLERMGVLASLLHRFFVRKANEID